MDELFFRKVLQEVWVKMHSHAKNKSIRNRFGPIIPKAYGYLISFCFLGVFDNEKVVVSLCKYFFSQTSINIKSRFPENCFVLENFKKNSENTIKIKNRNK